jgi:hypothetical protein
VRATSGARSSSPSPDTGAAFPPLGETVRAALADASYREERWAALARVRQVGSYGDEMAPLSRREALKHLG